MSNQSPEKTYRLGNVSASVFKKTIEPKEPNGQERVVRSVALQRSYMDGDERKYTSSFGLGDLPNALRVLKLAYEFVEIAEVDVTAA